MGNRQDQPGPARLRYGAEHRLRKRKEYSRVYRRGRRAGGRHLVVFCAERLEGRDRPWRLGLTATRKTGGAVKRNRQRRRIREYFRLNQSWIPDGWDFVVNTRVSLNEASHAALRDDLDSVLSRLGFHPPEHSSAS